MTLPESFLDAITASRRRDPLAPVTVVVPSHIAGIQLRRRLAERGPFAGVRFETLPRLAELIGAGDLARGGRSPLARPIGDYLAAQVAHEARSHLAGVRELPGFARVLRQTFRRLRRGGFARAEDVPVGLDSGLLGEVVRLYGLYRYRAAPFYDDEDLLDAAAASLKERRSSLAPELGEVYVVPPGALTAGSDALLAEIRKAVGASRYNALPEPESAADSNFILAPDPAAEAREVAREVVAALEAGTPLHEIAVFHGADRDYRVLLTQAFEAAGVPVSSMPGTPLSETAAGRGILMLAALPAENYARTRTIDWLSLAPLRTMLPAGAGRVAWRPTSWRRLAREAGITQGAARWQSGLDALLVDIEASRDAEEEGDPRRARYEEQHERTAELRDFIASLAQRLEPLRQLQPAAGFIDTFKAIVDEYIDPSAAALAEVTAQIDQLGTIDSVEGRFSLDSFTAALRANLDAAYHREASLGDGVLVAEYSLAAGLSFQHAVLCGAYEGVFPSGAGTEPLVDDRTWQELRRTHPMVEDAGLRLERNRARALRAVAAGVSRVTWSAPLQASGAGRDHYPSQLMLHAARAHDTALHSATDLRRSPASDWLRKPSSPMAALLTGLPLDLAEVRARTSVAIRRDRRALPDDHPLAAALAMLQARRSDRFGIFDGNLTELGGDSLFPRGYVSPTSLEHYATCGFRYYLRSVLRLRPPDEPEERDTMDSAQKGSLVHEVLHEFFSGQQRRGRPRPDERWTDEDRGELLQILEKHLILARERGRTGLEVFAEHEARRLRADLSAFLDEDSAFRAEKGVVPQDFELDIPATQDFPVQMVGKVDRIDWKPDRSVAYVIDYKTGSARSYEGMKDDDPLDGGKKLQLPVYLAAAAEAKIAVPLYWFISSQANFSRKEFSPTTENLNLYRRTLQAILDGIKQGVFPAISGEENSFYNGWENCTWCDFNRLCSRRRDDEMDLKAGDALLRPWHRVGQTARERRQ